MIGSSPQLPDVHFREIDGEALKRYARIWLESVLDKRFDGETSLADLLVDGEILDRVSTKIRNVLPKHSLVEPMPPISYPPEAKHGGKYLPYSNVESFIKLCQRLGLAGVDLFSPSDVVEKKDIRKVCLCIRALSKKARSIASDLPDFDLASHSPVAMPKEFVEGIRGSLSAGSSPSGPTNIKNSEATDKVTLSPLQFKGAFAEYEALASEILEDLDKEGNSSVSDAQTALTAELNSDSVVNPKTPPVAEEARSLILSDDEKSSLQAEAKNVAKNLEYNSIQTISSEDIPSHEADNHTPFYPTPTSARKDDVAQRNVPEMTISPTSDGKDTKRVRFLLPLMASGVALVGVLVGAFLSRKSRETRMYEVKKGDTLAKIARKTHKHRWQELLSLNPWIKNPNLIYPNQRLRLHP